MDEIKEKMEVSGPKPRGSCGVKLGILFNFCKNRHNLKVASVYEKINK
jgi:hypothetical protein